MNRILRAPWKNGAQRWHTSRQSIRHQSNQQKPKVEPEPIDIPSPQPWHQRLGPVTRFFGWFHRAQQKRPLTVQTTASAITYLIGDLLAQDVGGEVYDGQRTLRMVAIGTIGAPAAYPWFMFLGNHFNYASKWASIAVKVVVQQTLWTPVFNTYFFGMQAILTGEPPSGIIQRIKDTVPTSIKNSAKFWPAVTAFSFTFIAPEYRLMFSGVFAVVWQTYLSALNRRAEKGEIAESTKAVKA